MLVCLFVNPTLSFLFHLPSPLFTYYHSFTKRGGGMSRIHPIRDCTDYGLRWRKEMKSLLLASCVVLATGLATCLPVSRASAQTCGSTSIFTGWSCSALSGGYASVVSFSGDGSIDPGTGYLYGSCDDGKDNPALFSGSFSSHIENWSTTAFTNATFTAYLGVAGYKQALYEHADSTVNLNGTTVNGQTDDSATEDIYSPDEVSVTVTISLAPDASSSTYSGGYSGEAYEEIPLG